MKTLSMYVCMYVYISACIPVVFAGEVVYDGGADSRYAPLAVVPSSCDDRELRSTQTVLTICRETGQRRTKDTHKHRNAVNQSNMHKMALASACCMCSYCSAGQRVRVVPGYWS